MRRIYWSAAAWLTFVGLVSVVGSAGSAQQSPPNRVEPDRRQYVTPEGQAMVVVQGPVSIGMGSPIDERGRQPAPDSPAVGAVASPTTRWIPEW